MAFMFSCLSLDSYIKPQRPKSAPAKHMVVYLLIPTSNHNQGLDKSLYDYVVYLLIPTSNHNPAASDHEDESVVYLLIPTSNHNLSRWIGW